MKKSIYALSLLGILSFFCVQVQAQSTTPGNSPTAKVFYEYNMKTGFKYPVPFDQPFTIMLTGLDTLTRVQFRIYETGKIGPFPDGIAAAKQKAERKNRYYEPEPWIRTDAGDTGYMVIPATFRPNRDLLFERVINKRMDLTLQEKETLAEKVMHSPQLNEIIGRKVQQLINGNSYNGLNIYQNEINQTAQYIVQSVNSSYVFFPPDRTGQTVDIADFITSLRNVNTLNRGLQTGLSFRNTDWVAFAAADDVKSEWISTVQRKRLQTADDSDNVAVLLQDIDAVQKGLQHVIEELSVNVISEYTYTEATLATTYDMAMVKAASLYITLDEGVGYSPFADRFFPYTGVNFYLRPVNKNIPLSKYTSFSDVIGTRLSLLLGITLTSIEKEHQRKGIVDNKGVILGAGFRILSFLRVNGGGLMYYKYDANPLVSAESYHAKITPFVSLSLDLDVKPLFEGFWTALIKK